MIVVEVVLRRSHDAIATVDEIIVTGPVTVVQQERAQSPGFRIPEVEIPFAAEYEWLPAVLERAALVKSRGEAIRLIQQGAVRVEGERITDKDYQLSGLAPAVVQVGKRRYAKIIPHLSPR